MDVILKDGTYHHFTPRVLDVLLESHRVHKFKRSSGWTTIGVDPVRTKKSGIINSDHFNGQERRMMTH
ncbi:MAG: hypothetical protein KAU27_13945 [Desulfuromonadales bacterium]|nr:hypothetical protein [Desulfuromonadales bacterium]